MLTTRLTSRSLPTKGLCNACRRSQSPLNPLRRSLNTAGPSRVRRRWPYPLGLSIALLPGIFWFLSSPKAELSPQLYSTQKISSTTSISTSHKLISIPIPPQSQHLFSTPYKTDGSRADPDEVVVQHMMIGAPQIQIERPYTPINDPQSGEVQMIVKRVKGGEVGRLVHSLQEGQDVEVRGPIPTFSIRPSDYDRIVMVSTGTGAAPFLQLLSRLPESKPKCHLVHLQPPPEKEDWLVASGLLRKVQDDLGEDLVIHRPPASSITADTMKSAIGENPGRVIILICLPPHLMRPLCGGLTRTLEQGPLTGLLSDIGLSADQVWKLE